MDELGSWLRPPEDLVDAPLGSDPREAWRKAIGADAVMLVRDPDRARELILRALDVSGKAVTLPANALDAAAEAVRKAGGTPRFGADGSDSVGSDLTWRQAPFGIGDTIWFGSRLVDGLATLPDPGAPLAAEITLLGLHLHRERERSGAIVVLRGPRAAELGERLGRMRAPDDEVNPMAAMRQLNRLTGMEGVAVRQRRVVDEIWSGLRDAAGVPLLAIRRWGGLPLGVVLRVPDAVDAATFFAYVAREGTPIRWLPWLRPVHYAAFRAVPDWAAQEAAELARWLVVPATPDATRETIAQSVLGVVKAAEYLGVRWWTNPGRAAAYAALLGEWYGPDHDGFRVASYARCGPGVSDVAMWR